MGETHNCPVANCVKGNLPHHILMCYNHWKMVSKKTQREVYDAWNGVKNAMVGTREYLSIRQKAIDEVDEKVAKQKALF